MSAPITIILAGEPRGKGRPRFGNGRSYTDEKTENYEAALRIAAMGAMGARRPIEGPVAVDIEARVPVPASWSQKKRLSALAGDVLPTTKPDIDNIVKTWDALNHVVFNDDRQIVQASVRKVYHEKPALIITVSEV
ncbi:endodeoxyribonuclease RusA [Xanthobacter versatilis]|uniref:Endodeoxyribonuclease RusA n=1 Tax=Xanthobacter autotrophicus (strain ATCC BAA-1158 / Py2) TaxID=78245 RepID=A7ILM9_XANP2|nr:endodeoxyribonuclease RusA [Xanthobacter autotrophicus Py2]